MRPRSSSDSSSTGSRASRGGCGRTSCDRRRATIVAMTDDLDDLRRVLGYREAHDLRRGAREVGSDLLSVPFWTPGFCAAIIRAAEAVGAFEPQPDDPVPGHEVSLAV